ncbi:hypothetical protein HHI36_014867 [Cryptolaemus montrouzieri]|uniref:Uncharacterized protein n=1 Tax=Cryptolaemus montrouzieri TaxID=559131 RepID=A0ABD2N403_9CUCU
MLQYEATPFLWTIFLISSCAFIILLLLASILCAGCENSTRQLNLDNNPKKNRREGIWSAPNNSMKFLHHTFRRYSLSGEEKNEEYGGDYHQFNSDNLPLCNGYHFSSGDETLMEITDKNKIDLKLKIGQADLVVDDSLDMYDTRSCISKNSRNSYYSTYPYDDIHPDEQFVDLRK